MDSQPETWTMMIDYKNLSIYINHKDSNDEEKNKQYSSFDQTQNDHILHGHTYFPESFQENPARTPSEAS